MPRTARRGSLRAAFAAAVLLLALSAATASAQTPLRVSGIPDEAAAERERRFAPLGRHLERRLAVPVEYQAAADHASLVDAVAAGRVDLAWFSAYYYLLARQAAGGNVKPLVQREEDERFVSVFVASPASGIARLEDLRGKDFAFGAAASSTGHLMPRWYLMQAGVDPRSDLAKATYSGAHEATVNHVAAGRATAGALNAVTWRRLVAAKRVDTAKVQAFFQTARFNDYAWVVRGDLDPTFAVRIRDAMLALDRRRPDDARVLDAQRATRFIEAREADYAPHEAAAKAAGLLR